MLVLTAIVSVGMLQVEWNGAAGSTQAGEIDTLLDVMIVLSSFVFSVVMVMLGYSVWKYRAKPGDESDGAPVHGNTRLEIAWTVVPTVIVLFAAAYGWIVLNEIEEPAAASDQVEINITAQQYKWTFEYPDEGITSDELHVPVDRQLEIRLTSLDVVHSFWVPEWRIKRDAVPYAQDQEVDNRVLVTPDTEGSYSLVCTELCGYGHATMRAPVVVHPQDEFDQWLSDQQEEQEGEGEGAGEGAGGGSGDGDGSAADGGGGQ